jgi:hypothetical protein
MIARRRLSGRSRPFGAQFEGEALSLRVTRTGEREHPPPLIDRDLRDDVRRRSETVQAEALCIARHDERTITDQTRAEERCGLPVGVADRDREAEARVRDRILGVSAVDLVAGKPCRLAQVLSSRSAESALAARPSHPRHADPASRLDPGRPRLDLENLAHYLVSGDQRQLRIREISVHDVEIGSANPAGPHPQQDLTGLDPWSLDLLESQRLPLLLQDHRLHRAMASLLISRQRRAC